MGDVIRGTRDVGDEGFGAIFYIKISPRFMQFNSNGFGNALFV